MNTVGFDNDQYIRLQSQKIQERIASFGGKLYLEFGGKLFDDYHARILPGHQNQNASQHEGKCRDHCGGVGSRH